METWKTIKDFDNYEVSNYGNVRRKECVVIHCNGIKANYNQKSIKQENVRYGYKRVTLSQNNKQKRYQVHRLVALHFISNDLNKPCVNHIDGNPSNNYVSNLEWCTYSENEIHSYKKLGKINPIRKLNDTDAKDIRNNCITGRGGNVKSLAKYYGVSQSSITNIINNRYYV
jgi:hypothetical protein